MRKKERLPQKEDKQQIHISRQGWVDIFMCKSKVGDSEKLNLGREGGCCSVILWAVEAGMAAEHSDCLRWSNGDRAESITASGICSASRTHVARKLLY